MELLFPHPSLTSTNSLMNKPNSDLRALRRFKAESRKQRSPSQTGRSADFQSARVRDRRIVEPKPVGNRRSDCLNQPLLRFLPVATRPGLLILFSFIIGVLTNGLRSALAAETGVQADVKSATIEGRFDGEKARLVIQADFANAGDPRERSIYAGSIQHAMRVSRNGLRHEAVVKIEVLQGLLREVVLPFSGEGSILQVTGEALEDWSVRQTAASSRSLVLRLKKSEKPVGNFAFRIEAETLVKVLPAFPVSLLFTTEQAALATGFIRIDFDAGLDVQAAGPSGLIAVNPKELPDDFPKMSKGQTGEPFAFRFQGAAGRLPLKIAFADPEAGRVVLNDFKLTGRLSDDQAAFTLSAVARVRNPSGGRLELLRGVALTELGDLHDWRIRVVDGRFVAEFDRAGEFPIQLQFQSAVIVTNGWNEVNFAVATSALQPVILEGLKAATQFRFDGAARPDRMGDRFTTHLPSNGEVRLAWKEGKPEVEGRLFYAVEALTQLTISPGLLRQTALMELKIMQGELSQVVVVIRGPGEVVRVQGPKVLAWAVEKGSNGAERRLVVQFNEAQKEGCTVLVQLQQPLGAFPQTFDAAQLHPESATRFGGFVRVVNEGAVRLEVASSSGLSQVSPNQIPQTEATQSLLPPQSSQRFAYKFSRADFQLRVQADNILPEVSVSAVLVYQLTETELSIDANLELDIREAPLREVVLRIPKGFGVARLQGSFVGDHVIADAADSTDALLRITYTVPVEGRQILGVGLERNRAATESRWILPNVEVVKAKSVRGHLGVISDAGFRLTPALTQGLTEIASAFFPKKLPGIQAAFRINEAPWQATFNIERLAQSIQADVFHLFSVGEGVAYGSSVMNYTITGAPISVFKVEVSGEYFNVEFTGKNIRSWQKSDGGYTVQLHTPVSGSYRLLANYERPFKPQGEILTFNGARPLDATQEQGHTVVISAYQFHVLPTEISPTLTPLEPGEVPAEHRLLFDAPILAAYRYSARPINLQLQLQPLAFSETLAQVVDRAALTTRISGQGQVVTEARYLVRNKGGASLRTTLPANVELWSVLVNGHAVVPVKDQQANLIPLPQHTDPNTVNDVRVKFASKAEDPNRFTTRSPAIAAPVLLAQWKIEPEPGRRVLYRSGTVRPAGEVKDNSGFGVLSRLFTGQFSGVARFRVLSILASLLGIGVGVRFACSSLANRYAARHLAGGLLASSSFVFLVLAVLSLYSLAGSLNENIPNGLELLAPVQQAGTSMSVDLTLIDLNPSTLSSLLPWWPLCCALTIWGWSWFASGSWPSRFGPALGWTIVSWAALRLPEGAPVFFLGALVYAFLHVLVPSALQWWRVPSKPTTPGGTGPAVATAAVLLTCLAPLSGSAQTNAFSTSAVRTNAVADSIIQDVRVDEEFVFGRVKIRWNATQGQSLPFLHQPAVLTKVERASDFGRVVQLQDGERRYHALVAEKNGLVEFEVNYQASVRMRDGERGFVMPAQPGLVNRVSLSLVGLEVDIVSPSAVSIALSERPSSGSTSATLVLAPKRDAWIGWKPRSRDARREKAVFYAEWVQAYVPATGVVEGIHSAQIRPAQGQLADLVFAVPVNSTITDVNAVGLSTWRFDPDNRRLRVAFTPPQSRPFSVLIKSQIATGPLPFEQSGGLMSVLDAAGEVGFAGVATGNEVQLDSVDAEGATPINLEDFPGSVLNPMQSQIPGLGMRRAFRYSGAQGTLKLKASQVEPDVRVESNQTLSLGEDRILLALTLNVEVTRAGVFKLSFLMPPGMDVESATGGAMTHWTDLKADEGRIITLHLKGRTEGKHTFSISLTGPGVRSAKDWQVPRVALRESVKQRGQLLLIPEQGLRPQIGVREGATQLDPLKSGVRQKGVLLFGLLQTQWRLSLDIEQMDAWIQVSSLQHVEVGEAQLKVSVNLAYEIENTGVKSLRVRLPSKAEAVRFKGAQVSDFKAPEPLGAQETRDWEIKLERRVIGKYFLQLTYSLATADQASEALITGAQVLDVTIQRGFLTLMSGGRRHLQIGTPPPTLQPTDWQVIPRALQVDLNIASSDHVFRAVESDFRLPLQLQRHEATRLLQARVNRLDLTSVIADNGTMLTHVRMQIIPGEKRLLPVKLPPAARFWFAFVNQNTAWLWKDKDRILIPLEQPVKGDENTLVEFFYSSPAGLANDRSLALTLEAPKFDLPLENIAWKVFLDEKWKVTQSTGTLRLQESQTEPRQASMDLDVYVQSEAQVRQNKTRDAEVFLNLGNSVLSNGDPQEARRAFKNAYGLSQHDNAFNEDARVQLQNLKIQQALVGLNVRQAKVVGESSALAATPKGLREGQNSIYTQEEAKQLIERNTAEDNTFQMRLVERLIRQQDAAVAIPAAIRASVPEQGQSLTFVRSLEVNTSADLSVKLRASTRRSSWMAGKVIWFGILPVTALLPWLLRRLRGEPDRR